jgi:hypothetical protein
MSDGVGDPLGEADDDVGRTLGRAWARPPLQHRFTAQIGFGRKGFDDDRTVIGVWADGGVFADGRGPRPGDPQKSGTVEPGAPGHGTAATEEGSGHV